MRRTKIEWVVNPDGTQGYTWNPVTGCLHGCDYCYARKIANRFYSNFKPDYHTKRLNDPIKNKKHSTIFVCSMADLFGDWIPNSWIEKVLNTVKKCPQHTFLFLTKNSDRYSHYLFPQNSYLGITVTRKWVEPLETLQRFIANSTNRKFISYEPLLSNIECVLPDISWVIIGSLNQNGKLVPPEKGGARKEWVINLLNQADRHHVPVFIKNSLYELYPDLPQRRDLPYLL